MKNKCNKYYSLLVFRDSEEFSGHIQNCNECRTKHNEINEIENLVRFSKPAYLKRKKLLYSFKINNVAACFTFIFLFSFLSGNLNEIYLLQHNLSHPKIAEYTAGSIFNRMNLPTDEYGLLDPNRKFYYE